MHPPDPVSTLHLFPEERAALLDLLSSLTPGEWDRPTVCEGWSVKDVALHILGGDLANISRRRDGFGLDPAPGEELVTFLNRFNDEWVSAGRRLSPRVLVDLLAFTGPQLFDYFSSLDLSAMGGGVSWAGLDRAPIWLDVAREYTERWLHQQHIRDAAGTLGLTDPRFFAPVLATFVYALPPVFQSAAAPPGTAVHVRVTGAAGGEWSVVQKEGGWTLYEGGPPTPSASVEIDETTAWRLFTKGITPEQAEQCITFEGDQALGRRVLQAVAIIA